MVRTSTTATLAFIFGALSLSLSGCGEQPPAPQAQPDIYVDIRVPAPQIITRDIYIPTPAPTPAPIVCDRNGKVKTDSNKPLAPTTTQQVVTAPPKVTEPPVIPLVKSDPTAAKTSTSSAQITSAPAKDAPASASKTEVAAASDATAKNMPPSNLDTAKP